MFQLIKSEVNQNSVPQAALNVGRLVMVNATKTTTIFGLMPLTTMVAAIVMLRAGTMTVAYLCSRV